MKTNIDLTAKSMIAIVETADAIKEALKKQNLCIKDGKIVPIKTKFKNGDWVVCDNKTSQMTNVLSGDYYDSNNRYIPKEKENCIRPWTIQDAKKGDILANDFHMLFIFQGINKHGIVTSNFGIINNDKIFYAPRCDNYCGYIDIVKFRPATKDEIERMRTAKEAYETIMGVDIK